MVVFSSMGWLVYLYATLLIADGSAVPATALMARGGDVIQAGGCQSEGTCQYKAFLSLTDLEQNCLDGSWLSFAWPHVTSGATIYSIELTYTSIEDGGDFYLMADGGGCPDTSNILWEGCCALSATGSVPETRTFCTGPIETGDTTWLVVVPRRDVSFETTFDLFPQATGQAFVNLSGGAECAAWQDLTNYQSPYGESYGGCYCVGLGTEPCEPEQFSCGDEEPVFCEPTSSCDGDANADGVVDPLDVGYILARFSGDLCAVGNCKADVNCDGTIDPLDAGYALARLAQCNPATDCPLDCP